MTNIDDPIFRGERFLDWDAEKTPDEIAAVTPIGAIVGDVVGSRYEWHNVKTKDFPLFGAGCRPTDDTVMTLAIGDALLEHQRTGGDLERLAVEKMQEWGRRHPNAGYGGAFRRWLASDRPAPYNSWGNGAAMRVSMCGWRAVTLDEAHAFSDAVTRVTHNHPEGLAGARVTAGCVYLARICGTKDEIREYVESTYRKMDFTLDEIRPSYRFDVSCQGSVPQALAAFFEASDFEDAIRNAISIGGDSDTIGAITGAVAGAFWGVPVDIRRQTEALLSNDMKSTIAASEKAWR